VLSHECPLMRGDCMNGTPKGVGWFYVWANRLRFKVSNYQIFGNLSNHRATLTFPRGLTNGFIV
jgi:hypothetical protein